MSDKESNKESKRGKHPASKANLQMWKPGQSGNPEGGRAHDPTTKIMRKLTTEYFKDCIDAAVNGNLSDLVKIAEDPNTPVIKVGIAKCLADAVTKGNWDLLEKIIARLVGKVPDQVDVTSNGESVGGVQYIVRIPSNGRDQKRD